jgi:hypothetical protein
LADRTVEHIIADYSGLFERVGKMVRIPKKGKFLIYYQREGNANKMKSTLFTPAAVTMSALLILSVIALVATTTTTAAYAQPQNRGNACPEGFELNKGRCEAPVIPGETTTTPATCSETLNGIQVLPTVDNRCAVKGDRVTPELCSTVNGDFFVSPTTGENICIFPPNVPGETTTTDPTCPNGVGTINGDICTIKPGNRGGNRA